MMKFINIILIGDLQNKFLLSILFLAFLLLREDILRTNKHCNTMFNDSMTNRYA